MTTTRAFTREFLLGVLYDDTEGAEIISNEMYDTSRWSIWYELIFKFEDKYYQTTYSRGATENQYEEPWEYESGDIECTEVAPIEKVVIAYVPV